MQLLNSTQIPNKILEAIFNKEFLPLEGRILLFICRKTIGWQKETDWLTQSKIAKELKTKRHHIGQAVISLIKKKAIIREGEAGKYIFSLNSDLWGLSPKRLQGVTEKVTEPVTEKVHTKDNVRKDTNTKDIERKLFREIWDYYSLICQEELNTEPHLFSLKGDSRIRELLAGGHGPPDIKAIIVEAAQMRKADLKKGKDDYEFTMTSALSDYVVKRWKRKNNK